MFAMIHLQEKGLTVAASPRALTQEGSRAGHHQRGDDHQDIQELHTLPPNTTSTSPFGFRIVQVLPPDLLIRTLMIFPPMFFSPFRSVLAITSP